MEKSDELCPALVGAYDKVIESNRYFKVVVSMVVAFRFRLLQSIRLDLEPKCERPSSLMCRINSRLTAVRFGRKSTPAQRSI